jgi:hypothetical protein
MVKFSGCKGLVKAGFVLVILINLVLGPTAPGWGQDVAVSGVTVVLAAPIFMRLTVGSPGTTIDRVTFRVAGIPGSGAVPGESTGTYPVPFQARGLLDSAGTVALTADSSNPLNDGMGHTISFTQVYWQGSGVLPSGRFSGSSPQIIWQQSSSGFFNVQGAMAFFYDNTLYVPAGTYQGRVTYTLSVP